MAISKNKKEAIVQNLKEELKEAEGIVFVKFRGLSVEESTDLRNTLRKENCSYKVAKKTLIKRVLDDISPQGEAPILDGEVAISYGKDQIAPARGIFAFTKKAEDKIKILGGILENKYLSSDKVISLAKIPSREVLYEQVVGTLNAPIVGFVGVLDNTVSSFVRVLNAIAETK